MSWMCVEGIQKGRKAHGERGGYTAIGGWRVSGEPGYRSGVRRMWEGSLSRVQHFMCLGFVSVFLIGESSVKAAERRMIKGRVVGVHDGDTVTILVSEKTELKVRLEGIDAPELKQPFGQRSKAALSEMAFGQEVTISEHGTVRYKRTLGRITFGGGNVNVEMVKRGMAWRYDKYSKDPALIEAQALAMGKRVGLWAEIEPVPPWEWRAKKGTTRRAERTRESHFNHHFAAHGMSRLMWFSISRGACVGGIEPNFGGFDNFAFGNSVRYEA